MSKFRDLIIDVQDDIDLGELTFRQIAEKYGVTYEFVNEVAKELQEFLGDNEY